jgi:transcriptional regulator with XRE-family HTH domain
MIELIDCEDLVFDKDNFDSVLRRIRGNRDITQYKLADLSGLTQSTISAAELGRYPTMLTVWDMLDAMDYELVVREKR